MNNKPDNDVDREYLLDCLKLTPEQRFIRCAEFSEFMAKLNKHGKFILDHDHPEAFVLR